MKSTFSTVFLLLMLLGLSTSITAQCDYPAGDITISSTGGSTSSLYTTDYVLVDDAGDIVEINSSPSFTAVGNGAYTVYAINYKNLTPPPVADYAVGKPWADIDTWAALAASCADLSPGLDIRVGTINDVAVSDFTVCSSETADQTVTINNADPGVTYTIQPIGGGTAIVTASYGGATAADFDMTFPGGSLPATSTNYEVEASLVGCTEVILTDQVEVTIESALVADAGSDVDVCGETAATLSATGTGTWSGGAGTFSSTTDPTATYTPTSGEVGTTVTLTWTVAATATCPAATDNADVNVASPLVADAGSDVDVCGETAATLSATGTGSWTGGAGTFSSTTDPTATYTPTSGEVGTTVTLTWTVAATATCPAATDNADVNVASPLVADAGSDVDVCGETAATLSATGTGTWSGGAGTFSSTTDPTATYTPTSGEVGTTVTLTWTVAATATCPAATDNADVNVASPLVADAGSDVDVCGETAATLSAIGTGTWSGGAGTFSSTTDPTATYTPTSGEVGTTVTLTWTVAATATCPAATDNADVNVASPLVADAGSDVDVCGETAATLSATGTGTWTGGAGTFSSTTDPTATYTPTSGEVGTTVTLTWTVAATATCPAATDNADVNVASPLVADAGSDVDVCGETAATLSATGTGTWSGGAGTFSSTTDPTATYTPTSGEVGTTVTLTWTVAATATCPAATDNADVNVASPLVADAGSDVDVCGETAATLSATGTGTWSGGAGTFSSTTDPTATYTPTSGEVGTTVTLTWTVAATATCPAATDNADVNVASPLVADAGSDVDVCGETAATLSATGTGTWTGGAGTFSSTTDPTATYTPTSGEVGTTVTLTWTVVNVSCTDSDDVAITFTSAPLAEAGTATSTCDDLETYDLSTIITGSSANNGTGVWSVVPADGSITGTTYTPSTTARSGGLVTITYTVTGIGTCSGEAATDTVDLTLTVCCNADAPTISK